MTLPAIALAVSFLPFFEAKNTVANYVIDPPAEGAEKVSTERPSLVVSGQCPTCGGVGEIVLEEQDFGQAGAGGRLGGPRKVYKKCLVCGGKKRVESFVDPAELAVRVAADREKFNSEHQSKGDIAVGFAYVPHGKYETLDKNRQKLVAQAYGEPCRTCNWTGVEPCRKCKGRGVMECPNGDCKGGWAVTKNTTSYQKSSSGGNRGCYRGINSGSSRRVSRKETKVNVQVCPDCGGAHVVTCPECGGRRAIACRKCGGTGTKQKGVGL